jgi:sn-glycerol 3-phosphate transport system ATP-binding protein
MAELTLTGITKQFGKTDVIHAMDIHIQDGEFLVVVGPSGCGKSTLLRMIAGLEQVSGGHIRINGHTVNNIEPKDRDIAMVFQNYALYPHMSVFNNMAYGLKLRKISKIQIRDRVNRAARLLQLDDLLDRKPRELSGGQRQRVAMGRAIVRKPSVFLFDEPLSNLDAKLRASMRVELKKLHTALKTTMIYVTHDQVEAMTLADRILVMNQGRIEQLGTPEQVFFHPETLFTARFIGSPEINLLNCDRTKTHLLFPDLEAPDQDRGRVLKGLNPADGTALTLSSELPATGPCLCGIRPEHLFFVDGSATPDIRFSGQIDLKESLGSDTLYHIQYGPRKQPLIVRGKHQTGLSPGDRVDLGFLWEHCHFFGPDTGKRIPVSIESHAIPRKTGSNRSMDIM